MNINRFVFLHLLLLSSSVFASNELILPVGAVYKVEEAAKVIEYCPDNTCDIFQASQEIPIIDLKEFAALYFFYVSGYVYLEKPIFEEIPFRKMHKAYVGSVIKKHNDKCTGAELEAVSCILKSLANKWSIRSRFVRYDEGEKHVMTRNISEEISLKSLQSTASWFGNQ